MGLVSPLWDWFPSRNAFKQNFISDGGGHVGGGGSRLTSSNLNVANAFNDLKNH